MDGFHHGEVASENMESMAEIFRNRAPEGSINISLLLTIYYDGVQLFKRSVNPFWPLLVSINNLPPHLRGVYGVGIFSLSHISVKPGTPAEEYILSMFVEELRHLYEGFTVKLSNGRLVFLQARVVCHVYDTRAMEHLLKVHGAGSCVGCPLCRLVPGWLKVECKKLSYQGHRIFLSLSNKLRYIGQSQQCCPPNYYKDASVRKAVAESRKPSSSVESVLVDYRDKKVVDAFTSKCCGDKNHQQTINAYLKGNGTWESLDDYPYELDLFEKNLYYATCDLRPVVAFSRVTQIQYANDARRVLESNGRTKEINGVKGFWPFDLPYADISKHLSYEYFHTFMNCAKQIFLKFFNLRSVTKSEVDFCKINFMHPFLWLNPDELPPWAMPDNEACIKVFEKTLESVYLPTGMRVEYNMRHLCKRLGHFRGTQKIHLVESCMDFITYM